MSDDMNSCEIEDTEMLDEYDFTNGVRGKYVELASRSLKPTNLEPDDTKVSVDQNLEAKLGNLQPAIMLLNRFTNLLAESDRHYSPGWSKRKGAKPWVTHTKNAGAESDKQHAPINLQNAGPYCLFD
jgi:hypothetical protein